MCDRILPHARHSLPEIVALLIDANADIGYRFETPTYAKFLPGVRYVPAYTAIVNGRVANAQLLLENLDGKTRHEVTGMAVWSALDGGNKDMLRAVSEKTLKRHNQPLLTTMWLSDIKSHLLARAIFLNRCDAVTQLARCWMDINGDVGNFEVDQFTYELPRVTTGSNGHEYLKSFKSPPLHYAIRIVQDEQRTVQMVQCLLDLKADASKDHGPLLRSVVMNKPNVVQVLLHAKASMQSHVLHLAAVRGHTEIVDLLLAAKADVDRLEPQQERGQRVAYKMQNMTPLATVVNVETPANAQMINLLLNAKANVNALSSKGPKTQLTPLLVAKRAGQGDSIIRILKDHGGK